MLEVTMKTLIFLVLLGIHGGATVKHSLHYFYTASSGVTNIPEFVTVGAVDGQPISYYDSVIRKEIPKQDWMAKTEEPKYWETQTQISIVAEQNFKINLQNVKTRLNATGGVHIVQRMYGCEWDDETEDINGFNQYGYDGEDFIALDLNTQKWIAPTPQAVTTKHKWDHERSFSKLDKHYLTHECTTWLKKYLDDGKKSLRRTVLPSVSLLQKTPSSPLSCHATGFYPDRAEMFWRKDGEELHEDVDQGEILPNHDGTFQMSVDLKLPSDEPEDWEKYECVFQLSGVKEDIVRKLDKPVIRTNAEKPTDMTTTIIIIVAVALLVLVIGAIGFFIYRNKMAKRPPSPVNSQDVMEQLNPEA